MTKDDTILGVVSIDSKLDKINELIVGSNVYPSQETFIVNKDGQLLIHSDESLLMTVFNNSDIILNSESSPVDYTMDDQRIIGYYHKIQDVDLYLFTVANIEDITRPLINKIYIYVGVGFLFSVLLGFLIVKIFGRHFVKPISVLSKNVENITVGKSTKPLDKKSYNPEIVDIANRIESLAEHSLQKKANELATIIESTSDGNLVADDQSNVLYVNSTFLKLIYIKLHMYLFKEQGIYRSY